MKMHRSYSIIMLGSMIISFMMFPFGGWAAAGEDIPSGTVASTGTVVASGNEPAVVAVSTASSAPVSDGQNTEMLKSRISDLSKALIELNEKLEMLWGEYLSMKQRLDESDQKNTQASNANPEQSIRERDRRFKDIETSLGLVRAEISQIREDIGVLKGRVKRGADGEVLSDPWYKAWWLPPAAAGVSVLALLLAL